MRAALALGSNLASRFGDSAATLREAVRRIGALGKVLSLSRFYDTAPVGYTAQPRFLNAALVLETKLQPLPLLRELLSIEQAMGRMRQADLPPKGPRPIDLDLLLYEGAAGESLAVNDPTLTLPHPEMHQRAFVLQPLAEIAPQMWHPVLRHSVAELLAGLNEAAHAPRDLPRP